MDRMEIIFAIFLCAVITFGIRAVPFLIFGGKNELPSAVKYLAKYLSPVIMAALIIYCLKGMPAQGILDNMAVIAGIAVTVVLHLWKKNTLLSIGAGTVVYMVLIRIG